MQPKDSVPVVDQMRFCLRRHVNRKGRVTKSSPSLISRWSVDLAFNKRDLFLKSCHVTSESVFFLYFSVITAHRGAPTSLDGSQLGMSNLEFCHLIKEKSDMHSAEPIVWFWNFIFFWTLPRCQSTLGWYWEASVSCRSLCTNQLWRDSCVADVQCTVG